MKIIEGLVGLLGEFREYIGAKRIVKEGDREFALEVPLGIIRTALETRGVALSEGKYEKKAKNELHAFVLKEPPKEFEARLDGTNWPAVLGCEKFLDKIKNMLLDKKINEKEIPQYKENVVRINAVKLFDLNHPVSNIACR